MLTRLTQAIRNQDIASFNLHINIMQIKWKAAKNYSECEEYLKELVSAYEEDRNG